MFSVLLKKHTFHFLFNKLYVKMINKLLVCWFSFWFSLFGKQKNVLQSVRVCVSVCGFVGVCGHMCVCGRVCVRLCACDDNDDPFVTFYLFYKQHFNVFFRKLFKERLTLPSKFPIQYEVTVFDFESDVWLIKNLYIFRYFWITILLVWVNILMCDLP